jgi:hypothetical protein
MKPYRIKRLTKRWHLAYWRGWRFWKWMPRRYKAWAGEIVYWRWLCFEVSHDKRTDILGDLMHGPGPGAEENAGRAGGRGRDR